MSRAEPPTVARHLRPSAPRRRIGLWYAAGALLLLLGAALTAPWGAVLGWPALAIGLVAGGYLGLGPRVFGKRDGRLGFGARIALAPYLLALGAWRLRDRLEGPPHHEIVPGLWLGRLVGDGEAAALVRSGVTAVVDLTCEHDEAPPLRGLDYRNVQVLDLTIPPLAALEEAVDFVLDRMTRGIVYLHCAQGIRRSAVVAAACLLASDPALGVDEACSAILATGRPARFGAGDRAQLGRYRARTARGRAGGQSGR